MDWFYPKRRGPQWKQGWTNQTFTSISSPPPALLTIFGIVFILLWVSQYTGYKAQLNITTVNFQLFLFLLPLLLILLIASYSSGGSYSFRLPRLDRGPMYQSAAGGIPWGIVSLVVVLLVLVSYQSSFHSKWLGGS
ncbi:hypothetical protein Patl1_36107 [Pistacia atlantica]|nr:hypothetical protein Patl1_36107 [Pistacia atlantica]